MKSGVIVAIAVLVTVGAAVPAVAQAANLPPLILKSPDDVSVTQEGEFYWHVIQHSQFLVVDDGAANPEIACHIETSLDNETTAPDGSPGGTKIITANAYHHETNQNGVGWKLPNGTHSVLCTITDDEGRLASATHTAEIDVRQALFASSDHKERLKRIAALAGRGLITGEIYLKVVKYYHTAGMVIFDAVADGNGGFGSVRDHSGYCDDSRYSSSDSYIRQAAEYWRTDSGGSYGDVWYKQCLEFYAEAGAFDRINLGF